MAAFYNRATLNYGGSAIDSNTVRGELNAALAVNKTAVNERYRPGDAVAYAITLTNSGASDALALQIRDDMGAYAFGAERRTPLAYVEGSLRYFVDGEPQAAPAPGIANGELTLRDIRVPAGGSAAILYAARVNEFAPLGEGAAIRNTVRLDDASSASIPSPSAPASGAMSGAAGSAASGTNGAANDAANGAAGGAMNGAGGAAMARAAAEPGVSGAPVLPAFASAVILPDARAQLSIGKALSPASVSPGEELTYTLTIENSGATAVSGAEGATVRDVFNPRLRIASVRFNDMPWSAPANYSYDENTGAFATAPGQLEVPAASFVQDADTGRWRTQPGIATIEITGVLR